MTEPDPRRGPAPVRNFVYSPAINLIETLNLEELRKAREDRNFKAYYTHISDIDEADVDLFYVKSGKADVLWDGRTDVIEWEMRFNKVSRHLIIWLSYPDY